MTKILDCIAIIIIIFVSSLACLLRIPFVILFYIIDGIYSDIKYGLWDEERSSFRAMCEGFTEGLTAVKKGIIKIWKS